MEREIILVGTYHFEQYEELIEKKENDIKELVEYLADFKPEKVALEWDILKEKELNKEYQQIDGGYSSNEIHQVGFGLANSLGHDKVYAVDSPGQISSADMIELNQTIQNSYPEIAHKMKNIQQNTPDISLDTPLIESYKKLNDKKSTKALEEVYLSFVVITDKNGRKVGFNFLQK